MPFVTQQILGRRAGSNLARKLRNMCVVRPSIISLIILFARTYNALISKLARASTLPKCVGCTHTLRRVGPHQVQRIGVRVQEPIEIPLCRPHRIIPRPCRHKHPQRRVHRISRLMRPSSEVTRRHSRTGTLPSRRCSSRTSPYRELRNNFSNSTLPCR